MRRSGCIARTDVAFEHNGRDWRRHMTANEIAKLKRQNRRMVILLAWVLRRLDDLNGGSYDELGPDPYAEEIRRFLKRNYSLAITRD